MKAWVYAGMGLLGLLAVVAATLAVVRSTSDEAEEGNILLGDWLVDPTCSFRADQVIVQFKGNRPTGEALGIISDHGARRIELSRRGLWLLKVDPDEREDLIEALAENPAVEYAERNTVGSIPEAEPCDSLTPTPLDSKRD